MKLYFLTGLPTETDEDTLGIAELARNCVEIGQQHHNERVGHGVGRRLRAQAVHAVPVVRPEHRRRAAAQGQPAARRRCAATAASSSSGTTRRPRWSRASSAAATAASAPVIEDVWRHGGTFQEWSEHFDLELWVDAHGRATGSSIDWYVHRHRTEDEVLPWDHISAGLHKDFLWQDWRDALAELGLEDCRWTPCYDCGACTGYGIEHVVASAIAAGRRQPGHRPGPRRGGAVPVDRSPTRRSRADAGRGARDAGPAPVREARQGPLHQPPRRRPHLGAGAAPGRAAGGLHRGLLAPAQGCTSGWPCRPAHESLAEYLDVDLVGRRPATVDVDCAARAAHRGAARRIDVTAARRSTPGDAVAAAGRHVLRRGGSRSAAAAAAELAERLSTTLLARRRARRHPAAQGQATSPTTSGPTSCSSPSSARPTTAPSSIADLGHPAAGSAARRARRRRCSAAGAERSARAASCRTHQWIALDGARQEPLPLRRATSAPHAEARAS